MQPIRIVSSGLAIAAALFFAVPAFAADDAAALGQAFCDARLKNDDAAVAALASPDLKKAIDEAQSKNDALAKSAPGDKPPLGDGMPYQSFTDKPVKCEVGAVTAGDTPGSQTVAINYVFPDQPDSNWTDRLIVVDAGGKKALDNVLYTDDSGGGSLRDALVEMFQDPGSDEGSGEEGDPLNGADSNDGGGAD